MKRIGFVFCLILAFVILSASTVRSQTPAVPAAKPVPQLTEVETLKVQNFVLKYQQLQAAIDQLQQQQTALRNSYQVLLTSVETEYPGYTVGNSADGTPNLIVKTKAPDAPKLVGTKK